ncbi:levansucrase and sucrase synthesis operon antiterminator [Paenibacillus albidus]|uniref:Levansucrase and sucrase synthesis operon antiterminator n=1 Tax=Paenibacillus albidus TaxID=2041023 RepID=A0A917FU26_9BACL|nr:PRD domain-containing protein [Paenibacillus albidus]GGG01344.1 levansucrase and sucrase synthesis operon antiterminator [Paenibacillus albidus]
MKIKKILNNNAVVVHDLEEEKIVMGSGIAFQKRKNDIIDPSLIEKVFIMDDPDQYGHLEEMLRTLPEEEIAVSEQIISFAERELEVTFNEHVHIALTDHLSFALERINKGMVIQNTLLNEIRILYPREFQIGLHAKRIILEKLQIEIPEDEVGYIAMHIHTAWNNAGTYGTDIDMTAMIRDITDGVGQTAGVVLDRGSASYERLVTQLENILQSDEAGKLRNELNPEIVLIAKERYALAYSQAREIGDQVEEDYGYTFTDSQLVNIAMEINRINTRLKDFTLL